MPAIDPQLTAHHAALCVNDFERARDFYTDFLGFELEGERDHRDEAALGEVVGEPGAVVRWAMLHRHGFRVELFKYYQPRGETAPRRQCDFGYTHLAFQVADVEAVYRAALARGYEAVTPPTAMRGGALWIFYLREPEGAVTEFMQFMDDAGS